MSVRALSIDLRVHNMHLRMPFRYGIVTLTALPHLFVTLDAEVDGKRARGVAADHLPPKWFTKNPSTHFRDDLVEMVDCIRAACRHAEEAGEQETVFDWWGHVYGLQKGWAAATVYPPLLWGFGVSLVERAMIDAFCRGQGTTFAAALRGDELGIRLEDFTPKLDRARPAELLPERPLGRVIGRHTVGLVDPLTDDEIAPADRVDDGLPQSLEDAIRVYGLKHFKIKLGGDPAADAQRLRRLAELITRLAPADFAFTLDANENFKEVEPFKRLWLSLVGNSRLKEFLSRLVFIEQPLHRDVALGPAVKRALAEWPDRPPLIIDESDAELSSLRTALECGYNGTSHKNCKGVFKSIANACMLESLRRDDPAGTYLISGEDLSNVGPVALLQDLVVAASLGIESIERNGQHYFKGLSMFPRPVQEQVVSRHGDLFHEHGRGGFVTTRIAGGALAIESLLHAPFGVGFDLDTSAFTPLDQWSFDSLGLG